MEDVRESELTLPDGRMVAWTECGSRGGRPVLRIPGTPGSRWSMRSDRTPWHKRDLWMITTERPGFGRSTRLPGRGFIEHTDDLVAILDHLAIDSAHVIGASGGSPYVLALSARHPSRVEAATVVGGSAPVDEDELDLMIPHNVESLRQAAAGDRAGMEKDARPIREAIMADPIGTVESMLESSPEADRAILADPDFRDVFVRGLQEALVDGVDGWVDEDLAEAKSWAEIELSAIRATITWYHSAGDRNCPFPAAKRLVDQIPNARLVKWPSTVGHLHWFRSEPDILDELLSRGRT